MRPHKQMTTVQKRNWRKFKKEVESSDTLDDERILFLAGMFADIFMTRPFIPCKCEGKKLRTYIRMIDKVFNQKKPIN